MNKEIVNKEKGCSTQKCPDCKEINTSYSIHNGVFQFWCVTCKKAYEGNFISDWKDFALNDGFNKI